MKEKNVIKEVVDDFGKEWTYFNQKQLISDGLNDAFMEYFHIFPLEKLNKTSVGFDMGCGSGRWAKVIAPLVKTLNCIDPSQEALKIAQKNLEESINCTFECATTMTTKIQNSSQDFGYCLGVLHHIPDTLLGLKNCVAKLKNGAPFLLYLYYRFDNKPHWFSLIWKISDFIRLFICRLPFPVKIVLSELLAIILYYPLAKTSLILSKMDMDVSNIPLSTYKNKSFNFMRTDSLDRFGTKFERRFTKDEIYRLMQDAGLCNIQFSHKAPFWVALGYRK